MLQFSLRYVDIAAIALLAFLVKRLLTGFNFDAWRYSSPPGPKALPFVGNAHQIPNQFRWLKYTDWSKTFGDIVLAKYYGQDLVILNSPKAAYELLEKRSDLYSDRARFVMAGELVGFEKSISFSRYGDNFRDKRKLLHRALNIRASKDYQPLQLRETRAQCVRILDNPNDLIPQIWHTAAAVILSVARGHNMKSMDDPYIVAAQEILTIFGQATKAGEFHVDNWPILKHVPSWFPGAGFKRQAMEWKEQLMRLVNEPIETVKRNMQAGTQPICYISKSFEELGGLKACTKEKEELITWTSVSLFGGGRDTTVSAITTFFLAMTLYPDVQKKAQAKIDRVTGGNRLPEFEDRDQMPYTCALLKEVLRWRPVAPIGVPHRLIRDDVYDGYFLKEGTSVIPNIWAMNNNEAVYPQPTRFMPERFLEADGVTPVVIPYAKDFGSHAFGFGRRICPGLHIADASLFITIATTLAVLDIKKDVDANGVEIDFVPETISGIVTHIKPWPCRITARSDAMATLVRQSVSKD